MSAAKDRSILFQSDMVRAILDGTKLRTRRLVKPQPDLHKRRHRRAYSVENGVLKYGRAPWRTTDPHNFFVEHEVRCPYGAPGDGLRVREAWRTDRVYDPLSPKEIEKDHHACGSLPSEACPIIYEADGSRRHWSPFADDTNIGRYRHGRFQPRWASRLFLSVTEVSVERLHDITGEEARLEGVTLPVTEDRRPVLRVSGPISPVDFCKRHPRDWTEDDYWRFEFANLWEAINGGKAGHGWAANDWLWVLSFKRLDA